MQIESKVVKINKEIVIKYENREVNLPQDLRKKICKFWNEAVEENSNLYNGQDYSIECITETDDKIEMLVVKTDYAHYLYEERVGIEEEQYRCLTPFSGILLLTSDNYYAIGVMDKTTSVPNYLQLSGGGVDIADIEDDTINLDKNIKRELKEELNLNLDEIPYKIKYMELPCEHRRVYGFFALGNLNMTKEELLKFFNEYKQYLIENKLEVEFSNLIFLSTNNALQELDNLENPKRPYLRNLIKLVMDDNIGGTKNE